METWAGELDVSLFRNILRACGIESDVYINSDPAGRVPKEYNGIHYIYLNNTGEVHWRHYAFSNKDAGVTIHLRRYMNPHIMNARWQGGRRRGTRRAKSSYRKRRSITRKA